MRQGIDEATAVNTESSRNYDERDAQVESFIFQLLFDPLNNLIGIHRRSQSYCRGQQDP